MKKTSMVNNKTGEVFDVLQEDCPFRTIRTASEYNDVEQYQEGSSITDTTGYEPLSSLIARCTRQVRGVNGNGLQVLDLRALKEESQGVMTSYDVNGLDISKATPQEVDKAFSGSYDPSDSVGFDKLQAADILSSVNDNAEDLSTSKEMEQSPSKAQATAPAVGKSDKEELSDDNEKSIQEKVG